MRRADFLKLTDFATDDFKSRLRRRQLPFRPDGDGSWSDYTPFEAFLTVLMSELVGSGASSEFAAWFFLSHAHRIQADWKLISNIGGEYFAGFALADDPAANVRKSAGTVLKPIPLFGALDQLAAKLQAQRTKSVHGIVLANASMAWQTIKDRAEQNEISLDPVF